MQPDPFEAARRNLLALSDSDYERFKAGALGEPSSDTAVARMTDEQYAAAKAEFLATDDKSAGT